MTTDGDGATTGPARGREDERRGVRLRRLSVAGLGVIVSMTAAPVSAFSQTPPVSSGPISLGPPAAPVRPRPAGYLSASTAPNAVLILPPPPERGSLAEKQDVEVFRSTRALKGTERWTLAARDAVNYLGAFDCALGLALSPKATPKTLTLLQKVGADAGVVTNMAKDHYNRSRPLVGNTLPICTEDQRAGLVKSFSYPSGHSTFSWASGLVLAEAVPDRASDILARARAFGESRVVCGVHFVTDVEEGRVNGAVLVAALHGDPAFRADVEAAAAELKAARQAPHAAPDSNECRIEGDAEVHTPWINPTAGK